MGEVDSFSSGNACQKFLKYMHDIRRPLAEYQAKKGISEDEKYNFLSLTYTVGTYLAVSLISMMNLVFKVIAIVDISLIILRFLIDKVIYIISLRKFRQQAFGIGIFLFELEAISFVSYTLYGILLIPFIKFVVSVLANSLKFLL